MQIENLTRADLAQALECMIRMIRYNSYRYNILM